MSDDIVVKDSNGNILKAGDAVHVIKELKVKGGDTLKRGTVFKNIRLIPDDAENIEAGTGRNTIVLKTVFLKRA
ncbi:MAG: PhnA domain-containing protein [Hyphomicrobiaceae bacterium]